MKMNKVYEGDVLEKMAEIKSNSIDCIITSPPYWQLRDYGWSGQWGLEPTYQEYLDHLISFMAESKRVLKDTVTIWINLGDTYGTKSGGMAAGQDNFESKESKYGAFSTPIVQPKSIHKCLMLIPHRFAIRCIDELGLILRNDIIWAKRNGMPESVTDRFSKKHEFFFFFAKQEKYYFDLKSIKDKNKPDGRKDTRSKGSAKYKDSGQTFAANGHERWNPDGKNPGDVSDFWDIPTKPNSTKHYATFNSDLIDKPIIAGCPKNGIILDPFAGIGTTLARGYSLERNVIGIEGKKEYVDIANKDLDILKQQIRIIL